MVAWKMPEALAVATIDVRTWYVAVGIEYASLTRTPMAAAFNGFCKAYSNCFNPPDGSMEKVLRNPRRTRTSATGRTGTATLIVLALVFLFLPPRATRMGLLTINFFGIAQTWYASLSLNTRQRVRLTRSQIVTINHVSPQPMIHDTR